tara:strand:+ start:597 stop:806 length:210 start_codon:yes stop_codon:yes gene_type:complete
MSYIYVKREEDNFTDFCTYTRLSDMAYFEVPCVLDSNNNIDYKKTEQYLQKAIATADEQMGYVNNIINI